MDKIIVATETLLAAMGEAQGTPWRDIVADGREALLVMLDRLAAAGAVDDEDDGGGLVDLLMAG